ncbi:type VII secretion protein EccCa [Rhizomonospora bruguierae]|uniref:type VII secretion protein EccCa n=1 Tax=Rhizomonospora bruguierae TaxID=1581705 RepID=UPI001BCCFE78|nr:type VII secretion protein EccCa [Micromonospora sp. NBRC 107566]
MSRLAFHRPARFRPAEPPHDKVALPNPPEAKGTASAGSMFTIVFAMMSSIGMSVYMISFGRPLMIVIGAMYVAVAISTTIGMALHTRGTRRRASRRQRRKYRANLTIARKQAREVATAQRLTAATLHPEPEGLWGIVRSLDRVWERRPVDPDFLHLRMGVGRTDLASPIEIGNRLDPMADYDWESLRSARRLAARMGKVDAQPFVADLGACGVVSILGPHRAAAAVTRALLCQLVVLHAPDDVGVAIDASDNGDWEWAKWLPHAFEPGTSGDAGVVPLVARAPQELADYLEQDLQERRERQRTRRAQITMDRGTPVQRRLVVVFTRFEPKSEWGRSNLVRSLVESAGPQLGYTLVFLSEQESDEPSRVDLRIRLTEDGQLSAEGGPGGPTAMEDCTPDAVPPSLCELIARGLSPLRLVDDEEQTLARTVPLTEMLVAGDPGDADIAQRWKATAPEDLLRVPVGTDGEGQTVVLDINESARGGYGPHGLVVGATGSGKSELLRTLVTGLSITHPPELLSFVLVDYKGGAAFAPLSGLPHVAGLITNLADDAGMIDRVHAALRGEQQRRQRMLRAAGNLDSIHEYQRRRAAGGTGADGQPLPPLPYLLIIVDEFGELLSGRPDMTDLFVQIGRVGRSLGMHLLMATQRLEEGRLRGLESHLSYRICLRTFSAVESRTVIGTNDAYRLPALPGSAYLKVDETVYRRFRVAHVSAPYLSPAERATMTAGIGPTIVPFGFRSTTTEEPDNVPATGADEPSGPTELSIVVERIKMVGRPAHQVWLPPLPAAIPLDYMFGQPAVHPGRGLSARDWPLLGSLKVPIGVVDLPLQQEQQPMLLDFGGHHGHLAIVGAPRMGRSTLLRTILLATMLTHTPDEVQFYCVDFGGGTLHPYTSAPHVSAVADRADLAVVDRTLAEVRALITEREATFRALGIDSITEFRQRRAAGLLPAGLRAADIILMIDNWGAVRTQSEQFEPQVQEIAARGLGAGVHLMLTVGRWLDIRPAVRDSIGVRFELRLNDPSESEIARRPAAAMPALPGRGLSGPGLFVQFLLPRVDGRESAEGLREAQEDVLQKVTAAWTGPAAPRLRLLPDRLSTSQLLAMEIDDAAGMPIGIGEHDLRPVGLDLTSADPHLLVFGDSGSGKTQFLRTFLTNLVRRQPATRARALLVDYRRGMLGVVPDEHLAAYAPDAAAASTYVNQLVERLKERMPPPDVTPEQLASRGWWDGPDIYLVVDDYDLVLGAANPLGPLVGFIPHAREVGLHIVLARRVAGASRTSHSDLLTVRLRELGTNGLILSGDPREGALVGEERAARRPPGRAVLVRRGQPPLLTQIAIADRAVEVEAPTTSHR